MLTRGRLLGAVAAVALSAVVTSVARAEDSRPVGPSAEAWYQSGLGVVVAPTYPPGTLHVGAAAGQETDRTYLRFELPEVPAGATVRGATVLIPVAADAGTQSPETAVILACAAPDGFDDGGGGEPPAADCEGAPELSFVDGDEPAFRVVLGDAEGGEVVDLALVPGGGDTWHVGFDGRDREGGTPPTVTVSYTAPRPTTTTTTTEVAVAPPATFDVTPPAPPAVVVPTPAEALSPGRAIAGEAEAPAPSVFPTTTQSASGGFRYAAIFGLPLLLLVVVWLVGDGLTRPVRLREEPT